MSGAVIILQSRMESTRLPGKSLLQINDFSIAVLAAKRLMNTGIDLICAISDTRENDILNYELLKNEIKVFRGNHLNVFSRFKEAAKYYYDNTIIIRATADNIFPDGILCNILLNEFIHRNLNYLDSEVENMPVGLRLELFRNKELKNLNENELSNYEKEHVTPAIIKKYGNLKTKEFLSFNYHDLRCTIDTEKDYKKIKKLFSNVYNPLEITFIKLCERLKIIE